LSLLPESELDLVLYDIDLHDRFAGHARRAGKKRAVLDYTLPGDPAARNAVWEANHAKDPRGYENARKNYPDRTPDEQKQFD
jgi:hypothetical protein